jgi:hypothetical protein
MRHMSFALTTPQFIARTKTVTRRLGWESLMPGDVVMGVEKGQGLKKGEKVRRLGAIRIKDVRGEQLDAITQDDVIKEGFPEMTPNEFVDMFCRANRVWPRIVVTRIEFEYVGETTA